MNTVTTTNLTIDVSVDSTQKLTFSGSGIHNDKIQVDTDLGVITFQLPENATVSFPSDPIQWTDQLGANYRAIDKPSVATVNRMDDKKVVLRIKNPFGNRNRGPSPTTEKVKYSFFVIVQTANGKFFGTDPTIVTMRPGSGMED